MQVFGDHVYKTADRSKELEKLPRIFHSLLLTTNFDEVIEMLYAKVNGEYIEKLTPRSLKDVELSHKRIACGEPTLIKLHGDVATREFVLTERAYNEVYGERALDIRRPLPAFLRDVLSVLNVIASFVFLVCDIPDSAKFPVGIGMIAAFSAIYIIMWNTANHKEKITLNINGSVLEICEGDLFACEGFKVIAFNEYFDTQVDDFIVSSRSLNGQYLMENVEDIQELDSRMAADQHLQSCILESTDRSSGKKIRYRLGSIFKNGSYFLTAFSRFDANNRAHLTMNDYINCLMNFWSECDILYVGQSVSMPLLGPGITRFQGYENVTEQDLLELMIWSFKTSKIRFQQPSKVTIVLTGKLLSKINLYELKQRFERHGF